MSASQEQADDPRTNALPQPAAEGAPGRTQTAAHRGVSRVLPTPRGSAVSGIPGAAQKGIADRQPGPGVRDSRHVIKGHFSGLPMPEGRQPEIGAIAASVDHPQPDESSPLPQGLQLLRSADYWEGRFAGTPDWLIDGLIHSSITLLAGAPKAGKSNFAVAIATAVAQGNPSFLGRRVTRNGEVVFACTDPGGLRETIGRADKQNALFTDAAHKDWDQFALEVKVVAPALVVIDNLIGLLPRSADINSPMDARLQMDRLAQITDDFGVPVLLLHHTSKPGLGGSGKSPLGSQFITGGPRQILLLERCASTTRLSIRGNSVGDEVMRMSLNIEDGHPHYRLLNDEPEADKTQAKADVRLARMLALARAVADGPVATVDNQSEVARWLEANAPEDPRVGFQRYRSLMTARLDGLVRFTEGRWRLQGAAAAL